MNNTELVKNLRAEHAKHFDAVGDLLFDAAKTIERLDRAVSEAADLIGNHSGDLNGAALDAWAILTNALSAEESE